MSRPNWTKVSDTCYLYTVGGIDFKIQYKEKEIKAGIFENHWLFTGSIDHRSWYEHILTCISYYEEAQIEAEKIVIEAVAEEMKYHLDLGNKFANMLSEAIRWNPEKIKVVAEQEDKVTIESGKSYIFSTSDSQLKKYNNTKVSVLRPLTEDECDIADIGNMFKVCFWDGYERDVFEDELIKEA